MNDFHTGGPIEGKFHWEYGDREQVIMPNGRIMCHRDMRLVRDDEDEVES